MGRAMSDTHTGPDGAALLLVTFNRTTRQVRLRPGQQVRFSDLRAGDELVVAFAGVVGDPGAIRVWTEEEIDATEATDGAGAGAGA